MTRKSKTFSVRGGLKLILLVGFIVGMGLATYMYAATDCTYDACPGMLPDIWPHQSAALGDTIRILGWNLDPYTEYNVVVMGPDGTLQSVESVTTDAEGDLIESPYSYLVPHMAGLYQVNLFASNWNGDLSAVPIATTTFFKWDSF